jgi:hypothetical protein
VKKTRALRSDGTVKILDPPIRMRRFLLDRLEDVSGTSGTGFVAEGVVFTDGTVALRWTVELQSTALYSSVDDLLAIHGHSGSTRLQWVDD